MNSTKFLSWFPRPGRYKSVLPNGKLHVDVYIDGREPQPVTLLPEEEVELYDKEIRAHRKSEILVYGYLAPVVYFDKDSDGNEIEVPAIEDEKNPNVISDDGLFLKLQSYTNADQFYSYLRTITSNITVYRYLYVAKLLDTPQSFVDKINQRLAEIEDEEHKQIFVGDPNKVDERRKRFLEEKIKR